MGQIKVKSVGVQLAVIDNIKQNAKKAGELFAKSNSLLNQAQMTLNDSLDIVNQTEKQINDALFVLKEIGVDDKTIMSFKDEIMSFKTRINNILNKLK